MVLARNQLLLEYYLQTYGDPTISLSKVDVASLVRDTGEMYTTDFVRPVSWRL